MIMNVVGVIKRLLDDAESLILAGDHHGTRLKFTDAVAATQKLPSDMLVEYDLFDVQYKAGTSTPSSSCGESPYYTMQ